MTSSNIDWDARKKLVNERKAEWLDKNKDQLKLIQYVISSAYDEFQESDNPNSAEFFVDTCDDAFRSLFVIVADLRSQDFLRDLPEIS